ncbi:MAG: late competence development ComFB family protein [Microcoleaceae cyanobacterium]
MTLKRSQKYHNIMEDLVAEEVRGQLASLSPRLTQYIKRFEVETYALNRLPTLYASSREGWIHQQKRARKDYQGVVKTAVRQAIAAVQRDLLRSSTPLFQNEEGVSDFSSQKETSAKSQYWQRSAYSSRSRQKRSNSNIV